MTETADKMVPSSFKIIRKPDETELEKKARRKIERRGRTLSKKLKRLDNKSGSAVVSILPKKTQKTFERTWDTEMKFVNQIIQVLPELKRSFVEDDTVEDDYLLDDEDDGEKAETKRERFLQKLKQGKTEETTRAVSHEELRARLHAKLAALHTEPNLEKREKKMKKKEKKRLAKEIEGTENKKKKFISKANPNLTNQQKGSSDGVQIKPDVDQGGNDDSGVSPVEKPPVKKPVVKSDGEVVYSKFDFVSGEQRNLNGLAETGTKTKPKPKKLLEKVQKAESTIARLTTEGKSNEAVSLVESQKWESALKRAQGEKIRDDPTLLKKTIKKLDKQKKVSKKKWQERTEKVEKLKESKQEKRQSNIQARKDERKKKVLKQQRKKGRIV